MTDCSRCTTANDGPTYAGPCPFADARVRPSPCADPTTEDNRTPIKVGMKLFNYYDGEWGVVLSAPNVQGWFDFGLIKHDRITTLNGVRVSTVEPPR